MRTRLECISSPQRVTVACRVLRSDSWPIASGLSRVKLNSVVSCRTRIGPAVASKRARVAAKCPARMTPSSTRGLLKKR